MAERISLECCGLFFQAVTTASENTEQMEVMMTLKLWKTMVMFLNLIK